jgi:hypothetical protein
MPNISETSASDISLSPAWSVMIIFPFMHRNRVALGCRVSVATWAQSPVRSDKRLGRPLDQLRTGDRQRPKSRSDGGRSKSKNKN